jgi:uncharacterized protein (DUF2147 family)
MKRILAILALLPAASEAATVPIEGRWQNPKDTVIIDVAPCGEAIWCGEVSWASPEAAADARESGTANLVGARLLTGLRSDGKGGYTGRVFLPERKMHATASVRTAGADAIIVRGCLIAGLLCKEQRWKRVS